MLGSNYLGQSYLGQGYAGTLGIQFDATANSAYQAASASYSFNITVGNNTNRIVVVSVGLLSVVNSVTALTIGGVAATKLRSDVSASGTVRTEIWYLLAPTVGINAVAVTLATASVSGTSADSLFNVSQANTIDSQNGGTGTTGAGGGAASISTTTINAGAWIVDAAAAPTTFTVGPNQVQRANISGAVGNLGQSDKGAIVTPGATTMEWDNIAALTSWTMSTVALKPHVGATQFSQILSGTLSFVGNILRATVHNNTATLSFSGVVTKFITLPAMTASLSFTGVFSKKTIKLFTGVSSFSGALVKTVNKHLSASLSFSGGITRTINHRLSGALSFSGSVVKTTVLTPFKATLSLLGTFIHSANTDLTGTVWKQNPTYLDGSVGYDDANTLFDALVPFDGSVAADLTSVYPTTNTKWANQTPVSTKWAVNTLYLQGSITYDDANTLFDALVPFDGTDNMSPSYPSADTIWKEPNYL